MRNCHANRILVIAGLVCILVSLAQSRQYCKEGEYVIRSPTDSISCQQCPQCGPGLEPGVRCDDTVHTERVASECKQCQEGTFSSHQGTGWCKPCGACIEHQKEHHQCTIFSDRLCGDCLEDYYMSSDYTQCLPCCTCDNDARLVVKECTGKKRCKPPSGLVCPVITTSGPTKSTVYTPSSTGKYSSTTQSLANSSVQSAYSTVPDVVTTTSVTTRIRSEKPTTIKFLTGGKLITSKQVTLAPKNPEKEKKAVPAHGYYVLIITFGVIGGFILVVFILYCLWRWRCKNKPPRNHFTARYHPAYTESPQIPHVMPLQSYDEIQRMESVPCPLSNCHETFSGDVTIYDDEPGFDVLESIRLLPAFDITRLASAVLGHATGCLIDNAQTLYETMRQQKPDLKFSSFAYYCKRLNYIHLINPAHQRFHSVNNNASSSDTQLLVNGIV